MELAAATAGWSSGRWVQTAMSGAEVWSSLHISPQNLLEAFRERTSGTGMAARLSKREGGPARLSVG